MQFSEVLHTKSGGVGIWASIKGIQIEIGWFVCSSNAIQGVSDVRVHIVMTV